MKAINLKTGYLNNPVGIDLVDPVLTWVADGGKKQTAYELKAFINGELKVDTGKVKSSSMRYTFSQKLHSKDIVRWNVTLWDENDKKGEPS